MDQQQTATEAKQLRQITRAVTAIDQIDYPGKLTTCR